MSKYANTEFSKVVNDAIDVKGYSERRIRSRAAAYKRVAEKMNAITSQINMQNDLDLRLEIIIAGSRGEGVVQLLESDIDMITVFRNFLCVDSGRNENDLTIVQTHMAESPPGYTKLIPLNMNAERNGATVLAFCTVYDLTEGHILLLSSCARIFYEGCLRTLGQNFYEGIQYDIMQSSGPSVPLSATFTFGGILAQLKVPAIFGESDNVIAMPYHSSTILETWKGRSRKHDWPPRDVIEEVSTMEGFVVPVGPKFSEEHNFEWRICYTIAEQKLVASFNPVQIRFYALIKIIFKQIISTECDLITSYMVKSIVFWVYEGTGADCFSHDDLIELLLYSLAFLLNCLHANFLPNYMIPSRNLLLGKGNPHDKIRLRRILRDLLKEGGAVVFRLPKLEKVTNVIMRNPELVKSYSELREKVENLFICLMNIGCNKLSPALLLSHDCMYNLFFEMWKDPMILEVIFSLISLFKMDFLQFFTDPSLFLQKLYRIFRTFIS